MSSKEKPNKNGNRIFQMLLSYKRLCMHFFATIYLFTITKAYNFTAFKEPTGAFVTQTFNTYISYDKWKLLYYYELNGFFENINIYKDCLRRMELICYTMPQKEQCEHLITEHQRILNHLNLDAEYIKIIQSGGSKKRRDAPFGMIGTYMLKPAFGTMDEEDAINISNCINTLIKNQKTHNVVLENSMSIIRQEIRLNNATFEKFRNTVNTLHSYLNDLTSTVNTVEHEVKNHINFKYVSSTASLLLVEHQHTIRLIKNILKNTLYGDFTELIPYKQFLKDLKDVTHTLNDVTFMIIDSLPELQKTITILGTVHDKRLLIEIAIPILHRNLYQIYTIIPLPIKFENDSAAIMDTDTRDYLVNEETKTYIPMTTENMQECKHMSKKALVCFPQTQMYLENRENCESNLIFGKSLNKIIQTCPLKYIQEANFIKPLGRDSYYIYIKKMIPIRENCNKKMSSFSFLNQTGILTMNPHCEIILNGMKIFTKNTRITNKIFDIAPVHNPRQISIENIALLRANTQRMMGPPLKFMGYNEGFNQLLNLTNHETERLKTIKEVEKIEKSIITKNIIILVIIIIIILIVKALIKKLC